MSSDSIHAHVGGAGSRPRSVLRRFANGSAVVVTAATFVGLAAAGIAALHGRAHSEPKASNGALVSVQTQTVTLQDGYQRVVSYTGWLEAARETALAFERAGLILSIAADEGDAVKAGDTIARLDTSELLTSRRQLQARRDELAAQRRLAELTLGRQSELQRRGWSPEQRLDEAKATTAQLAAASKQVAAQIDAIEISLAKSVLKAPYDGHVAARHIDDGAVVTPGQPVVTLLETGRRQARVGLPPDVAATLRDGARYTLTAGEKQLNATLASRRPDLQTGTRTVTVLLDIDSGGDGVALGELVTLDIGKRVDVQGAWLPLSALKEGQRGMWTVLAIDKSGGEPVVRPEAAEVLHAHGGDVYVRGTFPDGADVLVGGTDRVVAGQRVTLIAGQGR